MPWASQWINEKMFISAYYLQLWLCLVPVIEHEWNMNGSFNIHKLTTHCIPSGRLCIINPTSWSSRTDTSLVRVWIPMLMLHWRVSKPRFPPQHNATMWHVLCSHLLPHFWIKLGGDVSPHPQTRGYLFNDRHAGWWHGRQPDLFVDLEGSQCFPGWQWSEGLTWCNAYQAVVQSEGPCKLMDRRSWAFEGGDVVDRTISWMACKLVGNEGIDTCWHWYLSSWRPDFICEPSIIPLPLTQDSLSFYVVISIDFSRLLWSSTCHIIPDSGR